MKNIDIYPQAIMAGLDWVATPFAINYGFEHGYEDDYLEIDYTDSFNIFDKEKPDVEDLVYHLLEDENVPNNIYFGDFRDTLYGVSVKEYNTCCLFFHNDKILICAFNVSDAKSDSEQISDVLPMAYYTVDSSIGNRAIMFVFDYPLFKFSVDFYKKDLFMNFSGDMISGEVVQNDGWVRFDEGVDEDICEALSYSSIRTITVSDNIKLQLVAKMQAATYDYRVDAETKILGGMLK